MSASLMLIFALIAMVLNANGITRSSASVHEHLRIKRSDGLVNDAVKQMVAEQLERKAILAKFRKMEDQLDDVKRELKERNTLLHDTKFLQKKLQRLVKDYKVEIREAAKVDVKKTLKRFRNNILSVSKNLKKVMKSHVKEMEQKISTTNHRITAETKTRSEGLKLLHKDLAILKNQVANYSRGGHVAFSVKFMRDTGTISSTLIFDKVIYNVGNGYNTQDGKFHCSKEGTYMFSVTLNTLFTTYADGAIMKNGKPLQHLYTYTSSSGHPATSLTIAILLKVGDTISIKGNGRRYHNYCYFSGGLMMQ